MLPPTTGLLPRGHDFRVSQARHKPDEPILKPCDLATLLSLHPKSLAKRDKVIPHFNVGTGGKVCRRYSWAGYQAAKAKLAVAAM